MHVYAQEPVIEHLRSQGLRLKAGIDQIITRHGLERHVNVAGHPACLSYGTRDATGKPSQLFRTLLLQETIRRGVLAPSLVVSYSHGDDDIDQTIDAFDGALHIYRMALEDGVERHLVGRPSEVVFRRYNSAAHKA